MQSTETLLREEFSNKYRDDFEASLDKAIRSLSIHVSRHLSLEDKQLIKEFAEEDVTHDRLQELKKSFGDKMIAMNCFSGNMSEFYAFENALKAKKEDYAKAKRGETVKYKTVEEGKELQDPTTGDHAPTHMTHFNKGLGSNAGFVSMTDHGYVWQCFVDGYLKELEINGAKKLVYDRYGIMISDDQAQKLAEQLNKDRRYFEGKILQSNIGDSQTVKDAISIITSEGVQKSLSFEKTNILGLEARMNCQKFDHEAGKIIGKAVISGNCDELNKETAKFLFNFLEGTNQDVQNVVAQLGRMFFKAKRAKHKEDQ